MSNESMDGLAEVASHALLAEGRCTLTVNRSSQGRVRLEFRTHTLGKIDIDLSRGDLEDLLFGLSDVPAEISRCIPARKPSSYPANANVDLPDTAAQDSASKSNNTAVSG